MTRVDAYLRLVRLPNENVPFSFEAFGAAPKRKVSLNRSTEEVEIIGRADLVAPSNIIPLALIEACGDNAAAVAFAGDQGGYNQGYTAFDGIDTNVLRSEKTR